MSVSSSDISAAVQADVERNVRGLHVHGARDVRVVRGKNIDWRGVSGEDRSC